MGSGWTNILIRGIDGRILLRSLSDGEWGGYIKGWGCMGMGKKFNVTGVCRRSINGKTTTLQALAGYLKDD